ncbi:unnamed protein product [Microthlaspi erraticum]|uniref:LRAT domain-containing protein n=1 Tax=Microthlaspi erraticum TaxID=1685480 RepID=A0A6D2JD42_9BRAS|nr:unnamed protein product [Microthlaspi erraticum]
MGLISNKISRDELTPGDHIYSWRNALHSYAHHGIYVGDEGDGEVIHFTRPRTKSEILLGCSGPSKQCLTCISCRERSRDRSTFSGVISSCLDCFLDGGELYRYEYNVSRVAFVAKTIGGTCTLAPSDPPEDVLFRAKHLLSSEKGFGDYKLFKNNCESFALYCKTGLVVSEKFGKANSVSAASCAVWCAGLVISLAGLPMVDYAIDYSYGRLESDIARKGREDVKKVPVEDLVAICQCNEQN